MSKALECKNKYLTKKVEHWQTAHHAIIFYLETIHYSLMTLEFSSMKAKTFSVELK